MYVDYVLNKSAVVVAVICEQFSTSYSLCVCVCARVAQVCMCSRDAMI